MSNDERADSLASQAASWVPPWERAPREPDRAYQAAAEEKARAEAERRAADEDAVDAELAEVETAADEDVERSAPAGPEEGEPAEAELAADDDVEQSGLAGFVEGVPAEAELAADGDVEVSGLARFGEGEPAAVGEVTDGSADSRGGVGVVDGLGAGGDGEARSGLDAAEPGDGAETAAVVEGGHEAVGVDSPAEVEPEPGPGLGELGPELPVPGAVEQAVVDEDEDGLPADLPLPADGDDAGDVFDAAADDDVSDDGDVDLGAGELVPGEDGDEDVAGSAEPRSGGDAGSAEPRSGGDAGSAEARSGGDAGSAEARSGGDAGLVGLGQDGGVDGSSGLGDGDSGSVAGVAAPGVAQPSSSAAAESVGERGRAKAGSAVPEQGRRRRNGQAAGGDGSARTSEGAEAGASRKVSDVAEPGAGPLNGVGSPAERDISDGPELDAESELPELPALMEDAELAAALEAILLVVDEPVGEMQLAQILEQPTERVGAMLEDLSARYTGAGHGFDLRRAAGGWRLYTRPEYAAYVERFVLDGQSVRLTQAALETLAVVAYKQPVTRSRISAIRGVNCDGVMRTLVTRGLIEECGTEGETGAHLYRTTPLFLEKLGLNSVDQLPPLAPFLPDDVEEVLDASG